jgi:hypothetical protein
LPPGLLGRLALLALLPVAANAASLLCRVW